MRNIATIPLAILIGLAAPRGAGAEVIREQSRLVEDANGITTLRVENARGEVDVRASSDDRIRIVALKTARSPSGSLARELAGRTTVETDRDGGTYRIHVRYPTHRVRMTVWDKSSRVPSVEVRLAIEVPARLGLHVTTASGRLATSGVAGAQRLRSASGPVEIDQAGGAAEVSTASGSIEATGLARARLTSVSGGITCEGANGALRVSSTSGDVTIQGADDSLRITTLGGDVRVDRAPRGLELETTSGAVEVGPVSGRLELSSVSGDADVTLAGSLTRAELETRSGALTVRLDPGLSCALEAVTGSGEVDFRLPVQPRTLSSGRVTARVRGGSAPVSMRSASGDITVVVSDRRTKGVAPTETGRIASDKAGAEDRKRGGSR